MTAEDCIEMKRSRGNQPLPGRSATPRQVLPARRGVAVLWAILALPVLAIVTCVVIEIGNPTRVAVASGWQKEA